MDSYGTVQILPKVELVQASHDAGAFQLAKDSDGREITRSCSHTFYESNTRFIGHLMMV